MPLRIPYSKVFTPHTRRNFHDLETLPIALQKVSTAALTASSASEVVRTTYTAHANASMLVTVGMSVVSSAALSEIDLLVTPPNSTVESSVSPSISVGFGSTLMAPVITVERTWGSLPTSSTAAGRLISQPGRFTFRVRITPARHPNIAAGPFSVSISSARAHITVWEF